MRRIFNWIKKAVTFDSDVNIGGATSCESGLTVGGRLKNITDDSRHTVSDTASVYIDYTKCTPQI